VRFDGYIRVSRVAGRSGAAYISPKVQREAIERWAAFRDVEIAEWHIDEDQSGGTQQRPGLLEAIRRIEAGETDGLACWRLNRFARNVSGAIEDVKRIQAAGGQLALVEEQIDPTGPFGQFLLTVLLAVATLERDNAAANFEESKRRAMQRGAYVSRTPFGYERRDDGTLKPHPEQAKHVTEAFRLAASRGLRAAHEYLEQNAPERVWTLTTVRRLLAKRSYLGEMRIGEAVTRTVPPLVSRAIWEAAQHDRQPRSKAAVFPLSGFAVCASCGNPLVGGRGGRDKLRTYRCSASLPLFKGTKCKAPTVVTAHLLEAHTKRRLIELAGGLVAHVGETDADALTLAEKAVLEAEAELDAFAADMTLRRALGSRYHDHLQSRVDALSDAQRRYRELARDSHRVQTIPAQEVIEQATPIELAELLRGGFERVVVKKGRGSLDERVELVPHT
jgi:DNA invertase Pin-like site-specific DNA recombinase